jgi:hypothetical protein
MSRGNEGLHAADRAEIVAVKRHGKLQTVHGSYPNDQFTWCGRPTDDMGAVEIQAAWWGDAASGPVFQRLTCRTCRRLSAN